MTETRATAAGPAEPEHSDPLIARVYESLADGEFHSGEELAQALGVTRSAIWKAVRVLRRLGVSLNAVRNRGYRMPNAGEPLDPAKIREKITRTVRDRVRSLDVAWLVGSTNTELLERENPPNGSCEVFLAEYQTAGRGRRGRAWVAPPGGSICLSLSWTFREVPRDLGSLGLVVGVCTLRALRALGLSNVKLKWPNDLLVEDRKLGGILIELRAESAGPACVVIGIGINVALGAPLLEKIAETGVAPTDLSAAGLANCSRNEVVGVLITQLIEGMLKFEHDGLRPFIEEWREADALRGRMVDVKALDGVSQGVARGIDVHGALMVETLEGLKRFISGDVTVRVA